jgi:hypothetical protein
MLTFITVTLVSSAEHTSSIATDIDYVIALTFLRATYSALCTHCNTIHHFMYMYLCACAVTTATALTASEREG